MHPIKSRQVAKIHGSGARNITATTTTIGPMFASSAVAVAMAILVTVAPPLNNAVVVAFVPASCSSSSSSSIRRLFDSNLQHDRSYLSMGNTDGNDESNDDNDATNNKDKNTNNENDNNTKNNDENDDDDGLSWRLAKLRLEEANTSRLLKRKPLKLPYATSQKWIQQNWAIRTKEEFEDLVANGNLRTPYISKRPEEYYGERGEWISWDHYLLGDSSVDNDGGFGGRNSTNLKWA
mmetsp:Transcript_5556/g.12108  ORF Transcript_5556/g.12108 Transcript_5556/m.12108 type:complete len:236 (-) Transcript_5556:162-869(-)